MREHQIVISLNPDQYREIQRLAKMAGTTSIGHFLHSRLLTFLGLKNTSRRVDTIPDTENSVDLTQLGETITRMHKELKQLLEEGEISGYITGTAAEDNDSMVSFHFQTMMQNDFGSAPSQPVHLPVDTVFSELGISLSQLTTETETMAETTPEKLESKEGQEQKAETIVNQDPESLPVQSRQIDYRTPPETVEEAIQAAASIDDELERLAEQVFTAAPLLGNIAELTNIKPLDHDDPLVDILDDGLVKILEERVSTRITSDVVKPNLSSMDKSTSATAQTDSENEEEDNSEVQTGNDKIGPPPKRRKR